jgi:hypothetical protein
MPRLREAWSWVLNQKGKPMNNDYSVWSHATQVRPPMSLDEADRVATELSEGNAERRTYYEVRDKAGNVLAGYCQGRKADSDTLPRVEVRRDGHAQAWFAASGIEDTNSQNNAWTWLLHAQGQSPERAMKYEGWSIVVIDAAGQEHKGEDQ